jgi:glucose-1-phosphate thymidylyltransferase
MTKVTNKHLLPVYDKPMIYYPLCTLISAGITEIMIVSGRGHAGHFLELLGSGAEFGVRLTYEIQEKAGALPRLLVSPTNGLTTKMWRSFSVITSLKTMF